MTCGHFTLGLVSIWAETAGKVWHSSVYDRQASQQQWAGRQVQLRGSAEKISLQGSPLMGGWQSLTSFCVHADSQKGAVGVWKCAETCGFSLKCLYGSLTNHIWGSSSQIYVSFWCPWEENVLPNRPSLKKDDIPLIKPAENYKCAVRPRITRSYYDWSGIYTIKNLWTSMIKITCGAPLLWAACWMDVSLNSQDK